ACAKNPSHGLGRARPHPGHAGRHAGCWPSPACPGEAPMNTTATDSTPSADHGEAHSVPPYGWRRWLFATNHKDIGTMYLIFSFVMLLEGGTLALLLRTELFEPGLQFFRPELFNQFTTMHGLIMVFGAI